MLLFVSFIAQKQVRKNGEIALTFSLKIPYFEARKNDDNFVQTVQSEQAKRVSKRSCACASCHV